MSDLHDSSGLPSRRRHERVWFKYQATFAADAGQGVSGMIRNVSLQGLFLTLVHPERIGAGSTGRVWLMVNKLKKDFFCQVAHIRADGVGLAIREESDAFSTALLTALRQEDQDRTGMDIDPGESVGVRLRDGMDVLAETSWTGRLYQISANSMIFGYPASGKEGEGVETGAVLRLAILPPRAAEIPVEGVVRQWVRGESEEIRCALVFAILPRESVQAIRELVQRVHARRLQRMISRRAATLALHSGADLPRHVVRSHVREKLERFYGSRQRPQTF
ncbi:MAG: PilZ domain-containing protein [Magnetococcales bacterium]|nr:PilZ domain-containing protein [Magnetococcales bacterium]